jgi:hypothetical protein
VAKATNRRGLGRADDVELPLGANANREHERLPCRPVRPFVSHADSPSGDVRAFMAQDLDEALTSGYLSGDRNESALEDRSTGGTTQARAHSHFDVAQFDAPCATEPREFARNDNFELETLCALRRPHDVHSTNGRFVGPRKLGERSTPILHSTRVWQRARPMMRGTP